MPIRIYALAKELDLDSKILVDICKKAGITGKGSALASLTDDEVEKVREHISGGGSARAARKTAARADDTGRAITRDDYVAPTGTVGSTDRIPSVPSKPRPTRRGTIGGATATAIPETGGVTTAEAAPAELEAPEVEEIAAAESQERERTAVEESEIDSPATGTPAIGTPTTGTPTTGTPTTGTPTTGTPTVGTPSADTAPPPPAVVAVTGHAARPPVEGTLTRPTGSSLPPMPSRSSGAPLPELPSRRKSTDEGGESQEEKKKPRQSPRTGRAIRLAAMPQAAPPKKKMSDEPAPQKPEIRLPLDTIRQAGRAGSLPLSEHLKKHETKRKAEKRGKGEVVEPKEAVKPRGRHTGPVEKEDSPALGGREERQLKRKRTGGTRRRKQTQTEDTPRLVRRRPRMRRKSGNTAAPRKEAVAVELPCTVRGFSQAVGVPVARVLTQLMTLDTVGGMPSINSTIDVELAEILAMEMGLDVTFRQPQSVEEQVMEQFEREDAPEDLVPRPPVITFLGHVDHGKTSLLDRIIHTDVVSGEKGGITQHIRAYRIEKDGQSIAFVDTPGHEAFTAMRARGANVTDIAVLVVAADDGIMPQTEEAISHARAAEVPIVVALNKVDLPGVDLNRTYQQLAAADLLPTEWGGDTEVIKTSAITGEGIDDLLDTLLTVAELHEYSANPNREATGTCIEAELHEGRGVIAKLLVQNGTLKVGDVIVCGQAHGRVKAMTDTLNLRLRHEQASPSTPVNVTGLDVAPGAGDRFYVLDDIAKAREVAQRREEESRREHLAGSRIHVTLENLFERLEASQVQTLNVILRADVRGSIEAIRKEMSKLEHPEVQIKILQATVGGVTEADVHLADASDAVIIGFNVVPDEGARALAEQSGVQIRRYDIIYQVTEDLRAALEGMLTPEKKETELGRALVKQVFQISRIGTIAGCQVLAGTIRRDSRIRVIRENRIIGDYPLDTLRREKDDAREVRAGYECGMKVKGFNDLKEGDVLEAYVIEEVARTL